MPGAHPTIRPHYEGPIKIQYPIKYYEPTTPTSYVYPLYGQKQVERLTSNSKFELKYFNNETSKEGYEKNVESTTFTYPSKISGPIGVKDTYIDSQFGNRSQRPGYQTGQVNQNADEINSLLQTQRKELRKYTEQEDQSNYEDLKKIVSQIPQTVYDEVGPTTSEKYSSRERLQQSSRENRKYPQQVTKLSEPVIRIETSPEENTAALIKQVNQLSEKSSEPNFEFAAIGVQPPNPINIKPYEQSVGPDPETCPCYLVEPGNDTVTTTSTTSIPLIGQLGFIPVVFVPYCPGNDETDSENMKDMFPSAMPVPYACDTCGLQTGKIETKLLSVNQLGNIENLREALRQAKLGFLNVSARRRTERRGAKSRHVKWRVRLRFTDFSSSFGYRDSREFPRERFVKRRNTARPSAAGQLKDGQRETRSKTNEKNHRLAMGNHNLYVLTGLGGSWQSESNGSWYSERSTMVIQR